MKGLYELVSPEVAEHLVQRLRKLTYHQYQVTRSNFLNFLNLHHPKEINVSFMLEYFSSLFKDAYGVALIQTAKIALAKPLKEAFHLDLNVEVFKRSV